MELSDVWTNRTGRMITQVLEDCIERFGKMRKRFANVLIRTLENDHDLSIYCLNKSVEYYV